MSLHPRLYYFTEGKQPSPRRRVIHFAAIQPAGTVPERAAPISNHEDIPMEDTFVSAKAAARVARLKIGDFMAQVARGRVRTVRYGKAVVYSSIDSLLVALDGCVRVDSRDMPN